MKKAISLILALTVITFAFFGCGAGADNFKGEWKFSKITDIDIHPMVDDSFLKELMKDFNAEDKNGVLDGAMAQLSSEGTFARCYLNFDGDRAYTYDPVMDREATWAVYKTGDNEGFISVYTELDVADGNPDPITNPVIAYNAETDTMLMTIAHTSYMVTLEFVK